MRISHFLLLLALMTSCQKQADVPVQALRINIELEPATFDPRKARDLNAVTICRMLFEGLTRVSQNGSPELAAAKDVEISEDGLQYVFTLREAYWSNGQPVTSTDFAESWRTILDPQFPTDIAYQLYPIKNGRLIKQGDLIGDSLGIQTPDPFTLVVNLEQPTPHFLELCAMSSFLPVPHRIAIENSDWCLDPQTFVGNGPFLLKAWEHADQIRVIKNPTYWDEKRVFLQAIDLMMVSGSTEIRMFEESKLDWAGSPLSTLPADAIPSLREAGQLKVNPLSGTYFYRVNTNDLVQGKKNPLSHPLFRKALATTIDRESIVKHLLQGGQAPARSLVPPEMGLIGSGYFYEGNGESARRLLADALMDLDLNLETMEPIVISFSASDRNMAISQAVQKQWEERLGIPVDLKPMEAKVFFQSVKDRNVQLAVGSWIADFNDPINFLEVFKYRDGSTNNTGWQHPKYIDLLNRSGLCRDQDERKQLMRQAEEILMDEMPIIPIFHYAINYLEREGVKDVALSPIGQIDFRWASIDDAEPSRSMR